jgi:hypothetical protein
MLLMYPQKNLSPELTHNVDSVQLLNLRANQALAMTDFTVDPILTQVRLNAYSRLQMGPEKQFIFLL